MNNQTPEAYKDEAAKVRTMGEKVTDVTGRLRSIGDQLGLQPAVEQMSSETYIDEIIAQIEECRSWVQSIGIELDKL